MFPSVLPFSEGDSLLLKLVEVFIIDANNLKLVNFSGLYVLDLLSLIFNFLSDLAALLEVVESILLLEALVGGYLTSDLL